MPLIRSVNQTLTGFDITTTDGTVIAVTNDDIPSNVRSQSAANIETWVNNRLNNLLVGRDFFAKVWVRSTDPLVVILIVSDTPITGYGPVAARSGDTR